MLQPNTKPSYIVHDKMLKGYLHFTRTFFPRRSLQTTSIILMWRSECFDLWRRMSEHVSMKNNPVTFLPEHGVSALFKNSFATFRLTIE